MEIQPCIRSTPSGCYSTIHAEHCWRDVCAPFGVSVERVWLPFFEGEQSVAHGTGAVGEEEAGEGEDEDALAEGAAEDEAEVAGFGEEAEEDAAGDDPPGALDLGGEVGGFGDVEAAVFG